MSRKLGFNQTDLIRYLRCDAGVIRRAMAAAGVRLRVRYVAGDGQPVYELFTAEEARKIIREVHYRRGSRLLSKLEREGP